MRVFASDGLFHDVSVGSFIKALVCSAFARFEGRAFVALASMLGGTNDSTNLHTVLVGVQVLVSGLSVQVLELS